ncbi:MAG: acyl-CoA carboxylase subunit beta [Flavobacteriaceae bacterium]
MAILKSKIKTDSSRFKTNSVEMEKKVIILKELLKKSRIEGTEASIKKARERKKLLARERIEFLIDRDSPFLELSPLAGLNNKSGFGVGGTNVCGIGFIEEKLCFIQSNIGTRKGGSIDYATSLKGLRAAEIAKENKLPTINLVESGGVNLNDQDKIFNNAGATFKEITNRSKLGLATISLVFGNATAGGAYVPGMSDYTVFQKKKAKVFLAGPPLVKMATTEVSTEEELGGAEMHSNTSGVSDYLAEDEFDAFRIAREIIKYLPDQKPSLIPKKVLRPRYNTNEINGIIPANPKISFDIRELITRIIDDSDFAEFKKEYGKTMVTGWCKIHGYPVGIVANNGVIFSEAANKACQFIQLANRNNTPILFVHNTTGFIVGKKYEEGGIIKNGAKLINVVSNSEVPHLSLMVGSSFGAGNYAMNGRSYNPRFLFSYPNSKLGVMGSEQLAGVMDIIKTNAAKKKGIKLDKIKMEKDRKALIEIMSQKQTAWHSSSEMWDDGVIEPVETRNYLGFCLAILYNQKIKGTSSFGVFRM